MATDNRESKDYINDISIKYKKMKRE